MGYIERAETLLKDVRPQDWDDRTAHLPGKFTLLAKVNMLLALAQPRELLRYSPDEPRVPAGGSDGGQWTDGGGTDSSAIIKNGIQTKAGFFKPVGTNKNAAGAVINRVNIFVGGGGDHTAFGNVEHSRSIEQPIGSNYYFTHADDEQINAFISALPLDTEVNLIGHSWGGDTAAKVVAANAGRIQTLITVDPVSWFPPDFGQVKSSVGQWVNVNAVGHEDNFAGFRNGNVAAGIGGAWNESPKDFTSEFLNSPVPHWNFDAMMQTQNLDTKAKPQDILNRE